MTNPFCSKCGEKINTGERVILKEKIIPNDFDQKENWVEHETYEILQKPEYTHEKCEEK